jgi:hypothetical protein
VIITGLAAAALLLCIGMLLGATWRFRVLQTRLHQRANDYAEERRALAKEWAAIRPSRGTCPQCTSPLPERDTYSASAVVPD